MTPTALTATALLAVLLFPTNPARAATPAARCAGTIERAAGRYAHCRLNAEAQLASGGNASRFASTLARCAAKLETAYDQAFARWGASCPTVEPVSAFDATIAQCTTEVAAAATGGAFPTCGDGAVNVAGEQCDGADLGGLTCTSLGFTGGALACDPGCALDTSGCARGPLPASGQKSCFATDGEPVACAGTGHDGDTQAGAPLAYVDNGDGTVTDRNTGLQWEKLGDDGSIHDKDTTYTWDDAFAVKIAALNAASFAGHADWRVPNVKELQSLIYYGAIAPAVNFAAFQQGCSAGCSPLACSCTVATPYWSSTSVADETDAAWIVGFNGGFVVGNPKTFDFRVRAVRGGS